MQTGCIARQRLLEVGHRKGSTSPSTALPVPSQREVVCVSRVEVKATLMRPFNPLGGEKGGRDEARGFDPFKNR